MFTVRIFNRAIWGVFVVLMMAFGHSAEAAGRVALVIGMSAYRNVVPLDNAGNDAKGVAATLQSIGFDVTGRDIVLVDDVLYTGRTIRAALDALFDQGRPRSVQLLALIDRGHRELPIEATYTGRSIPTSSREIIEVKLNEVDGQEQVLLVERVD